MIDTLSEQLMKEKAVTDDYKGQLAVLSCQVPTCPHLVIFYYSLPRLIQLNLKS